jgi:hypothetical protein
MYVLNLKGSAKCLVTSTAIPQEIPPNQLDFFFAGLKGGIVKAGAGVKVVGEKRVTIGGQPGIELSLQAPDSSLLKTVAFLMGKRACALTLSGMNDESPENVRRIFDSFRPAAGGTQQAPPNPGGGQPFPGGGQPFPGGVAPIPPNPGGGNPFPGKGPTFPPNPGGGKPFAGGGQPGMQQGAGPTISAVDLVRSYQTNRAAADKQYTGKTITVQGRVQGRDGNKIVLETGLPSILPDAGPGVTDVVDVYFQNPADLTRAARMGNVTVQGRCEGFNDILDVVIRNARLIDGAIPGGGNPFPGGGKRFPGGK